MSEQPGRNTSVVAVAAVLIEAGLSFIEATTAVIAGLRRPRTT